jgi:Ca2+-transporting ATPase
MHDWSTAAQLQVAEAALTGESVPVSKRSTAVPEATGLADRHCMVYSGTHVTAGQGAGRRGHRDPHRGRPHRRPDRRRERTEARRWSSASTQFGRAARGAALVLFVLVVLLGLWRSLPLAEVLMVAISQMVSMVPEGLPVAMTIALAVGMQRMADAARSSAGFRRWRRWAPPP